LNNYLAKYATHSGKTKLRILDLGCGNGWMSNRIAEHPGFEVFAIDLNREELEQGARCFQRENLQFLYADILALETNPEKARDGLGNFDFIVLAAAVQYFPDLATLIQCLRKRLNTHGEIHVLDAPFYPNAEAQKAAQQRSLDYYTGLGVPEMAQFYHHHLWPEAEALGAQNLNATLKTRLLQRLKWLPPFPWLRFR
jgi:2-polyprenyl-3-methyl-5-hydroxy-6-metoxy-1,4-benzoquinol methylase